ncbi:MAG: putative amidohydrolase [Planctomycetota bacterium]|jgi:predicted amidohydrolase
MKIALIQQPASHDKAANVTRGLAAARKAASAGAEVIAFAELAFERFYPQHPATPESAELAETIPGPMTDAFCDIAREFGVVIVLNLFERAGDETFDSSPVIDVDGSILGTTRMVHITEYDCFHERGYYAPGDQGAPVYETGKGKVGIAICYDRHFPEYMRALAVAGADVIFIPQAGAIDEWPEGLYEAEMRVAAFQNGVFTALCNRVGPEERLEFAGESFVCDATGCVIARAGKGTEETLHCELDLASLEQSSARKLFMGDRRPELYALWLGTPPA